MEQAVCGLRELFKQTGVQPALFANPDAYEQSRCDRYNNEIGHLEGYDCPECKNRGYFAVLNSAKIMAMRECKCMEIRRSFDRIKVSGLMHLVSRSTFDSYIDTEEWQKKAKAMAISYAKSSGEKWLYFGGNTGCGKTHLCTAICVEQIKKGRDVRYKTWFDLYRELSGNKYKPDIYTEKMRELKAADILYIDDFLKTDNNNTPTTDEIRIASEIIWGRYQNNGTTILSSEWMLDDIANIDKALGGRIFERSCKILIAKSEGRNYREKVKQ